MEKIHSGIHLCTMYSLTVLSFTDCNKKYISHGILKYLRWESMIQQNLFSYSILFFFKWKTLTTFIIDFSHAIDFCNCWMHRATCAALRASDNALLHTLRPGAISSSALHWNIEKLGWSHLCLLMFKRGTIIITPKAKQWQNIHSQ